MVVNDGSKDNTAGVAKQYYEKYPQTFRLVSLRKNRGKGAAMKVGVEVARGKYILMVRGCCPMDQIFFDKNYSPRRMQMEQQK